MDVELLSLRRTSGTTSMQLTVEPTATTTLAYPSIDSVVTPTPPIHHLGELLLAKLYPVCRGCSVARSCWKRHDRAANQTRSHAVLMLSISVMITSQLALALPLPPRVHLVIGGILLAASAGTAYLLLCYLLAACARTMVIGDLLLDRANPFGWQHEKPRIFLEICSWMASVWYSYTAFRNGWLSIAGGIVTALGLAVCSDFLAAFIHRLEAQVSKQHQNQPPEQRVVWLKVVFSYICVVYIITGSARILHGFFSGEMPEFQSVDDLVCNYLLITLVGVSWIVASELLLLYQPTRRAGIILQARIVDARKHWEQHMWRSLLEITAIVTVTVFYYNISQEMVLSLQLGTFSGVVLILSEELLFSNQSNQRDEIPADHWIKLAPLLAMIVYFCHQVYTTLEVMIMEPSASSNMLIWLVGVAAVILTIHSIADSRVLISKSGTFEKNVAGGVCVTGITLIALKICHGPPGVIFSCVLSLFCLSLSRECWDEIEINEVRRKSLSDHSTDAESSYIVSAENKEEIETLIGTSWSSNVLGYVKKEYPYLYKRVKWTFISIVVVSCLDLCSTFVIVTKQEKFEITLSQFSAGNVVVSTAFGYFTSSIQQELHPEDLIQTGVAHFKNRWLLFPLRAFVESAVFIGVFIGTFAATSTVFSSLTLAALSGIVVSVGGHWLCSRLQLTVGTHARVQLTATCALLFLLFLLTYASMLSLFSIYHYIDSIEAAFCLASLSGVVFLAASELFLLWEPTREVGQILQFRVTHARENWQTEPLRSFLELFTWFAVICGSFALYDDLLQALQLGTFSGIAVTLSGECFRRNRSKWISFASDTVEEDDEAATHDRDDESEKINRSRVLPVMLLFAYIGSGTFQWIFENMRSLEVTVVLATVAGIAFLCIADLLVFFKPTRRAGIILQDRFLHARRNWNENPVRSFVEFGCFLGVIYGSYAIYRDLLVAVQLGTFSGMLVTLIGEQFRRRARTRSITDGGKQQLEKTQILPLPMISLLGLVGAVAFNTIYTHMRSIEVAFVLATTTGVIVTVLGDMFVIWTPTRKVGLILQDRILHIKTNWDLHPRKTVMELFSIILAWWLSYHFMWPKDLVIAIQFGTFTGIATCVCGELTVQYLAEVERRLIQGVSSRLALNSQKNSALLKLPYEVLFEVAHYLSPDDLLIARASCHKVNNMLKAESARFWLHTSLRRKTRDRNQHEERSRIHNTRYRMRSQARSLVYEAITLVVPKIFGTREPTHVLTSGTEISRALRWVYLNADWIRKQNLSPLVKEGLGDSISLQPGDPAFEVFRHMPDKMYLGILVKRDEGTAIRQIDVPFSIYEKIQTDPFSFVAAETLSTLEVFSGWHLAVVAFATMTLIFIGQFSSDMLRAHVFPPEFKWWGVKLRPERMGNHVRIGTLTHIPPICISMLSQQNDDHTDRERSTNFQRYVSATHAYERRRTTWWRLTCNVRLIAVTLYLFASISTVWSQTTASVGYPDPRYSTSKTLTSFSCAGGQSKCPDGGEYVAAGGNLTITIVEMRNLPDLDAFGLAGLETDAYIRASIGDNVRQSGVIWNSLNPKWPPCSVKGCRGEGDVVRDLNFGFRPAGTEITIQVYDKDSGFEFGDDLIAQVTVHAIYCSAFTAIKQEIPSDDDSVWKMSKQPLCVEEIWIPLVSDGVCLTDGVVSDTTPCMRLRMTALPFQMRTEEVFLSGVTVLGGMGGYFPDEESWLYGRVYSASNTRMASYYRMDRSAGGLLIRSESTTNNNKGNASLIPTYGYTPYARVTINYDAELFVFRREDDAASTPEWLDTKFGWAETREYAQLQEITGDFRAVAQNFTAHPINEYGDAFENGIITGANLNQEYTDNTLNMYFIIASPHESFDIVPTVYSKEFSRGIFVEVMLQYFPSFAFVMGLLILYLKKMNWRIERIQSYLAEKVVQDEVPSANHNTKKASSHEKKQEPNSSAMKKGRPDIIAQLFLCYNESPNNIEFRRNLFYATCAINVISATPLLILIGWGTTSMLLVTPPAFGFGIIFLGIGGLAATYGLIRWVHMGWRMTKTILRLFSTSFLLMFVFLFTATFADPKVLIGGDNLDYFSISSIFLTLNMMPMIWIAFTNDSKLMKSLTQVIAVVGATKKVNTLKTKFKNLGTLGLKLATAKGEQQQEHVEKRKRKESVFAPLMGDHYTVEQSIPGFSHADILTSAFVTPAETRKAANQRLYANSIGILVIYCIVSFARTSYPTQSIGISITVMFVDLCVYMMYRGYLSWSAGYIVFLMSSVRICLAATCGEYWILGHAFLYMVFGTALCREIIGKNLPRMNKQEAGGVTFFGHDQQKWRHYDVSTTPEFVLGLLSFFYVFLLLAIAFGTDANDTIQVPVLGQEWPLWIFGVLAFIVVLFIGLALATSRAFFLQKEQLLSEYALQMYLFVKPFKLPFMLAAASEVLVICSGLFVFASTQSTFILVTSVFGPLILMLSLAVYVQWRKNDYRLVIWPPEDDEEDILDDDDEFDEEAALEKEAEIMRETFVLPPLKDKGNKSIYDGADETFKMPSLPPKSVLQGKLTLPGLKSTPQQKSPTQKPSILSNRRPFPTKQAKQTEEKDHSTDTLVKSSTGIMIVQNGTANRGLHPINLNSSSKPKTPARFALLRALFARKIGFRALFSKQTWKKYQEVGNLSPTSVTLLGGNDLSPRGGSTRPLLDTATSSRRKSSAVNGHSDIDFTKMSLYQAYREGFLLGQDYVTLGCFGALLFLVFIYGMILTATETPAWLGQLIWVGIYVLLFTLLPTVKYFKIGSVTSDMKYAYGASYLLAWITGFILFFAVMKANVNDVESLIILSILVFYPIFLLFIVTLCKWKDETWEITRPLRRTLGFCIVSIAVWIFEMYIYAGVVFGAALTFLLALFLFITFFLVKWAENDKYLAPVYQRQANLTIMSATILAIVVGLVTGLDFFYCLSIVFVVLILKYSMYFVASWFVAREDVAMFFSPYLFPVFSYNAYTNNVVDENQSVWYLYMILLLSFLWGVGGVMFLDPLGFGVGLCSLSLLMFAGITAHLCAVTPVKMGVAAKYVNEMILKDASKAAREVSNKRRTPFTLECAEFVELEKRERKAELEFQAIAYGGGLFSKKKNPIGDAKLDVHGKDKDEQLEAPMESKRSGGDIAMEIDAIERSCWFQLENGIEVRLVDGLLTWKEIYYEIFHLGVGPFGFMHAFVLPWQLIQYLRRRYFPSKKKKGLVDPRSDLSTEANAELDTLEKGERGAIVAVKKKSELTDLVGILLELPVLDEELDREFYEETRCIIHFQLLMMNAADARLNREKILFQKFLRENRFKLMSNGINPPANIFKTSSFASIDIPLVAVWLLSLTSEERARFHALKAAFNAEMERTDAIIDAEDEQSRMTQKEFREYWKPHEEAQCRRRMQEFQARRMRREQEGFLPDKNEDEALVNAQEAIMEIESGYSCTSGEFGRALQFVDREFPPDQTSIANCAHETEITGWKVSTAINVVAGLFDGGTDPDDVMIGKLNDSWLLSAISIVAASGGVDDGKVDALLDQIFITKQTSLTGAYALRLYKNCQWETVIVDDFFPVLADSYKVTACAGAAFAHSKDFEELWVPLLEKAFAKYYGGYAALEQGYVHHALKELTGYDSEEIFLAQASRGTLKKTLWKQMLIYKSNKFLMGAGTIGSENADTEILDTGLVFGACYVIYDVQEICGHQLVKLRNPPGNHAEWKGDWGDHSKLWTRRLKKLLHWNADSDDNTFWMNFDDFCHAFRSLYICRYYDPVKWPVQIRHGQWKGDTACGLPTTHNPLCTLECNPQFSLVITRPTEVMIKVTQVDAQGLAPVEVHPIAIYIVAQGKQKDRASRVKTLTRETVKAHSGEPVRQREVFVQCELPARTYTILVVAYKKGMEGPFKLKVQTNYPVTLEQLWPAVWKDPAKATMAEKMAAKVKDTVAESTAMAKILDKTNELASKLAAGAAVMESALKDDETILKEELAKQQQHQEEEEARNNKMKLKKNDKPKHVWIEQWDENAGKPFYFNKQTSVSTWEKPPDF